VASALPNTLCGKLDEPGCVFGTNVLVYPNLTWEQKKKEANVKGQVHPKMYILSVLLTFMLLMCTFMLFMYTSTNSK